jgi:hypothetical protein
MSPDQVLPMVLITVMAIVAIVLIVVGIQLFLLLKETRLTVKSLDGLIKNTNNKLDLLVNPLRTLGSLASGVAGGMKAFEAFSVWLKQRKK